MDTKGIIDPPSEYQAHSQLMIFFDCLILDLKKQLIGLQPSEPIDLERLNKASEHVRSLARCTEDLRKKYLTGAQP